MPGNPTRCPALAVKIYLSKRRRETSNVKLFARNQKITERWNSAMQMSGTATHRLENTAFFLRCPKEQDWQKKSLSVTILMASGVDNARVKSVTGHKSDSALESHHRRPALEQQVQFSAIVSDFVASPIQCQVSKESALTEIQQNQPVASFLTAGSASTSSKIASAS